MSRHRKNKFIPSVMSWFTLFENSLTTNVVAGCLFVVKWKLDEWRTYEDQRIKDFVSTETTRAVWSHSSDIRYSVVRACQRAERVAEQARGHHPVPRGGRGHYQRRPTGVRVHQGIARSQGTHKHGACLSSTASQPPPTYSSAVGRVIMISSDAE